MEIYKKLKNIRKLIKKAIIHEENNTCIIKTII